ncbi:MAG: DUF1566 domain-containing protein [Nitrospinaceae bacterium]
MDAKDRFQDNPNGVVSDELTGKFWLPKDAHGDLGKWVNWEEAVSYLQTMCQVYAGGFRDWRLPSKEEALSLYLPETSNLDFEGKTIHIHPVFVPKAAYFIWTCEVNDQGQALRINLRDGSMEYADKSSRQFHSTRGVRNDS